MNHVHFQSLKNMRFMMILLNLVSILFYSSSILLTTKYIINNQLAREFLEQVSYLPHHPLYVYFGSILLFAVLVFVIYIWERVTLEGKKSIVYGIVELIICLMIVYLLYMGYNGIFLLVFCDCMYHFKDHKYSIWLLVALIIGYLFCNYDVFSSFMAMPQLQQYFQIYDANMRSALMITKAVLDTLNIIMFIVYMVAHIAEQRHENENIQKELSMIQTVNKELQNYAAVTEKIGENNERKRLAREIHDTLGHALTGIAAGVDACIAMIDINPQATKQQLLIVSKVVRQGIGDVRNSLNKLRPGALEEHGLKGALEKMIEEFSSVSDLNVTLDYQLEKLDLENTKEDIIFRIIQESITNAVRHGRANHVDIRFYQKDHDLYLLIKDNGIGCQDIHYGFGLKQMCERVAIMNGQIVFDGHDGFLTKVKIPLQRGEVYDEDSYS